MCSLLGASLPRFSSPVGSIHPEEDLRGYRKLIGLYDPPRFNSIEDWMWWRKNRDTNIPRWETVNGRYRESESYRKAPYELEIWYNAEFKVTKEMPMSPTKAVLRKIAHS